MTPSTAATFSLPVALDSLETVRECIARVYGTGDARMSMQGERIVITEPEGGWGPRKRGRGSLPTATNDAMRLRYLAIRDNSVEVTIEDREYTVLLVSEIARQWFANVGGVNFVETKLVYADASEPEFIFTMQRVDGLSPADKLAAAEQRIADLEARIAEHDHPREGQQ